MYVMKIGISTWYKGNYGSILQAFAVSVLIRDMGHEPVFLKYDSSGGTLSKLLFRSELLGLRNAFKHYDASARGHLFLRTVAEEIQIRERAMSSFVDERIASSTNLYTKATCSGCLDEADAFLCGSDQIWNPANTCYSPFYWLSFVPADIPKIAYAPSMGMPRLRERDKSFIVSQINTFQDVSVRESATADLLNSLQGLNKRVEAVVDPTLLVSKNRWVELCETSKVAQARKPYAFAYILRGNPKQRAFCARLARSRGLKLVVYPYLEAMPQGKDARGWGDERVFDDDPADFLARIRAASLVITDSFHCTLFAILFHRDFYVLRKTYDTTSQRTRIDEILSVTGLEGRILEVLEEPCVESDFVEAEIRLSEHSRSSRLFLESAVSRAAERVEGLGTPADGITVARNSTQDGRRGIGLC